VGIEEKKEGARDSDTSLIILQMSKKIECDTKKVIALLKNNSLNILVSKLRAISLGM
jgi:hypothetical protein